jgi:hypothetical protein
MSNSGFAQHILQNDSGIMDARSWDFNNRRFPLSGYWTFHNYKLLDPVTIQGREGDQAYFPKLFNENNSKGMGEGYATYSLLVLVPDTIHRFALEIPQLYNSYALWVNGKLVSCSGKVGATREETVPQWRFQHVTFDGVHDTLSIVLQIANFHHNKGGAKEPIYLGLPEQIEQHRLWAFGTNIAEIIFLCIEAIVFFVLYLSSKDKKVILFFAFLCMTWAIRAAFSNLYTIVAFFPDFNWTLLVKIEYITLFGGIIWSILFLNHLFKNIGTQIITYLLVTINIFFVLFVLFTPPLIFSRWINVYLIVAGITVAYGSIIVIKALLYEQAGAWFLMTSLLCAAFVFGYDIVAYGTPAGYNLIFLNIGYMLIFMLITVALLMHLRIIKTKLPTSDILTYNDMFGTDETRRNK